MISTNKYILSLVSYLFLVGVTQGKASLPSLKEEYDNQQHMNANYEFEQFKELSEFLRNAPRRSYQYSRTGLILLGTLVMYGMVCAGASVDQQPLPTCPLNQTFSHIDASIDYPAPSPTLTPKNLGVDSNLNIEKPHKHKSKESKKFAYDLLDIAYRAAECCEPDIKKKLEGLTAYEDRIKLCETIVESWKELRPARLKKRAFSIKPNLETLIVNQRQYAIATADDLKYVLMTADLMKCVGLALYNPEAKRGGLTHLDGDNMRAIDSYLLGEIKQHDDISDIHRFLLDVGQTIEISTIRATIVSGSSAHINYIKIYLQFLGVKDFQIIHDPVWGKNSNNYLNNQPKGSIAIDCKTGKIWEVKNEPIIRKEMGLPPLSQNKPIPLIKIEHD